VWGLISAFSLNIGSIIGMTCLPSNEVRAGFMSFGGGALIFALTIELFGHVLHQSEKGECDGCVWAMEVAAVLGGAIFMLMNWILLLLSTDEGRVQLQSWLWRLRESQFRHFSSREKPVQPFSCEPLPVPECSVVRVLSAVTPQSEDRSTETKLSKTSEEVVHRLKEAPNLNSLAHDDADVEDVLWLVHSAEGTCGTEASKVTKRSPDLSPMSPNRLSRCESDESSAPLERQETRRESRMSTLSGRSKLSRVSVLSRIADPEETRLHGAIMVWLGILLDSLPESLVIGILVNDSGGAVSSVLPLILGVFLSNLPESMGASGTMLQDGMPMWKITMMWTAITLLTAGGATLGAILFPPGASGDPHAALAIAGIEGLAAGAMLTMIAQTMMPEASEQGGSVVGLSCLSGFLCALTVKAVSLP
jgi:zinc transporter ZupT